MNTVYAQKSSIVQKTADFKAASVLDSSSQSDCLQRKADMANNATQRAEAPRPNNTGMPDDLKSGIESLSGFSMDDVRVHYNSSKPATVQALAYTQGTDIHVAPGQEKCLPHEAWHVAQQMAGRVSPTTNINGMPVNDNAGLEHEADVMGAKAVTQRSDSHNKLYGLMTSNVAQRQVKVSYDSDVNLNEDWAVNTIADLKSFLATPEMRGRLYIIDGTTAAAEPSIITVDNNVCKKIKELFGRTECKIKTDVSLGEVNTLDNLFSVLGSATEPSGKVNVDEKNWLYYDKTAFRKKRKEDKVGVFCRIGDGTTDVNPSLIKKGDEASMRDSAKNDAINNNKNSGELKKSYNKNTYKLNVFKRDEEYYGVGSVLHGPDKHVLAKVEKKTNYCCQPSHYHAILAEMEQKGEDYEIKKDEKGEDKYIDLPEGNHYFIDPFG